jgi:pimeloyl-ACP methyl ester carboxylesterase
MKKPNVTFKRQIQLITAFVFLLSATLVSCGQKEETVTEYTIPYYETLYFADGMGYEFSSASSDKLIIVLDGTDWHGANIGVPGGKICPSCIFNWFLPLYGEYNLFVPEKFDWSSDTEPELDIRNREKYTIDNLVANYASVISEYFSQNDYEKIVIAGHSEGGFIAPELYLLLEDFNISAIIVNGAGGLSSFVDIAAVRRGVPLDDESAYLDTYNRYLAAYSGEQYADSPDEQKFRQNGQQYLPTGYWYSHQVRRPFEFYKNIDIPVLFIHGLLDVFVSPISTKYVEENLPDKPFDYIYYPNTQHYPTTVRELLRMRADIANWLREKGL